MPMMRMLRLRIALTALVLAPGLAAAQSAIGSSCITLDPNSGSQSLVLSRAVPVNAWIVVSVVTDSTLVQFATNPVSDTRANSYPVYDATHIGTSSGVLATFAGRATTALHVGDQISVSFSATGLAMTQSCAQAAMFGNVTLVADPSDGFGESLGFSNPQAVSIGLPSQYASELVYSVFAYSGTPGAITPVEPAQPLGQVSSSDGSLCLLPAWNLGAALPGVNEAAGASSANSSEWGGVVITFQSYERIFADGFE